MLIQLPYLPSQLWATATAIKARDSAVIIHFSSPPCYRGLRRQQSKLGPGPCLLIYLLSPATVGCGDSNQRQGQGLAYSFTFSPLLPWAAATAIKARATINTFISEKYRISIDICKRELVTQQNYSTSITITILFNHRNYFYVLYHQGPDWGIKMFFFI